MQIPIRKSERFKKYSDVGGAIPLTVSGIARLRATIVALEKNELPQAIADMHRTAEMGDFSENAAYQEAKSRLRRINSRILLLKDRLARAQIIGADHDWHPTGAIRLCSKVTLKINGVQKIYKLVGPTETDPSRGRISHVSPLGAALIDRKAGDKGELNLGTTATKYEISRVE